MSDAEGAGKMVREILEQRKPKVWKHLGNEEANYIKWLSTWAFHWAIKASQCSS